MVDVEEPPSLYKATVPPAPALVNPVTILLLLIFLKPAVPALTLLLIKVTLPVVLTFKFVNVFVLIFCDNEEAELMI